MAKRRSPRLPPPEQRFWLKVHKTETCWLWTDEPGRNGYGYLRVGNRFRTAHRYAYELLVGPISEGLELDHLCRVPLCCNPAHLEPVTHAENIRRGVAAERKRAKTHCQRGHPYDEANTYWHRKPDGTIRQRTCRTCNRENWRRRYREQKARAVEGAA